MNTYDACVLKYYPSKLVCMCVVYCTYIIAIYSIYIYNI